MLITFPSWAGIIGVVVGAFSLGMILEQKMQPAKRELGSRLLRY
jgi:hypothetical protein